MKNQAKKFQTKAQNKSPETESNDMELCNLPQRKLKIIVIEMLTEVKRLIHEQSETFNKDIENILKRTKMLRNSIIELKISLEKFNSRLNQGEERTIKLKDKTLEKIQGVKISKKKKKKT